MSAEQVYTGLREVTVSYHRKEVLHRMSLEILPKRITAVLGPRKAGKSTLLRLFNRMNDRQPGFALNGEVLINGENIYRPIDFDVEQLRRKVAMIFPRPSLFPRSVGENLAFGLRLQKQASSYIDAKVEACLRKVQLWNLLRDRLSEPVDLLNGQQQQRLCIARALTLDPIVLLLDEPAALLDPNASMELEALLYELKADYTIVLATHNIQKAGRLSDKTAFINQGQLVEYNDTNLLFTNPKEELTEKYISGRS